jgi:hypothetical protein
MAIRSGRMLAEALWAVKRAMIPVSGIRDLTAPEDTMK